jgi:hypothetical protein
VSFSVVSFVYSCLGFVPRRVLHFSVAVFCPSSPKSFSWSCHRVPWIWLCGFGVPLETLCVGQDLRAYVLVF